MTPNKKLFIRDINMETIVDRDDTFGASTSVDDTFGASTSVDDSFEASTSVDDPFRASTIVDASFGASTSVDDPISQTKKYEKPEFNIAIMGNILSGKSTLLNAIFGKTYSDMKTHRTAMIPSQYKMTKLDEIEMAIFQDKNNKLNEKYTGDTPWDGIEVPTFVVSIPEQFIKMSKYLDISIYDIPGLNDKKKKPGIYYKWVSNNTQNFDIIYLLFDINSGLDTRDEIELLQLVCGMMSSNDRLKIIFLVNKCDTLVTIADGTYRMEDEHRDIFEKKMIPIIDSKMKSYTINKKRYKIMPFCSHMIYIYRTHNNLNLKEKINIITVLKNTDNFKELNDLGYLNFKHLEEIMINDVSKIKWNKMTNEQKIKLFEKMLDINDALKEKENYNVLKVISGMAGENLLYESTIKFMNNTEIIKNIIFHLLCNSDPYENIMKIKNFKNIKVSNKLIKNIEFQKKLVRKALQNIKIDENIFKPSNIKNWSKIVLATCDILSGDDFAYENKIIIRGKEALFEYFEELYKLGMSDMQNHDFILQIPTILCEYKDIIEEMSSCLYKEIIYDVQLGLYNKYIEYFKDLINSPPSSFTEIAKLIDVCIKFSSDNSLDRGIFFEGTFLRLYDSFIENGCFGIVCSLQQTEGDYIYFEIDDCIYILETLKYIDNNFKKFWLYDIKIKARIMAVEYRISKYNAIYPNVNRRIIDYEYIIERVRLDLENNNNNNYYTILMMIRDKFINDDNSTHYGLNQSKFESESESESENPESESESE